LASEKVAFSIDEFRALALECPLPQVLDLIGERWTFLILRGALNGLRHFEEFQAGLGIARNILSDRLAKMVAGGILERTPDCSDRRKISYTLTAKGKGLLPALVALRQWGEEWTDRPSRIVLADRRDGRPIQRIALHAHDGRELPLEEVVWLDREAGVTCAEANRPLESA
jgi:DNA-binding HxlR family transcriptional regulator